MQLYEHVRTSGHTYELLARPQSRPQVLQNLIIKANMREYVGGLEDFCFPFPLWIVHESRRYFLHLLLIVCSFPCKHVSGAEAALTKAGKLYTKREHLKNRHESCLLFWLMLYQTFVEHIHV
jgi:hypothetical protein